MSDNTKRFSISIFALIGVFLTILGIGIIFFKVSILYLLAVFFIWLGTGLIAADIITRVD